MRHLVVAATSAIAVVLFSDAALAASIVNRDDRDHTVVILAEGESPREQVLKPNAVLADVCPTGCIVRIGGSTADYELEGPETVSIEDGDLYYDGPEASSEPALEAELAPGRKR